MMLDDLKSRWDAYDRKLDKALRLTLRLQRESGVRQVGASLRGLTVGVVAELALSVVLVLWLGGFMAAHVADLRYLLPAIGLHVFSVFQLVFGAYQWWALNHLDPTAPLLEAQRRLTELRIRRIRVIGWTFLLAPLLWVPLLLVLLKGVLGLDAYAVLSPAWLAANIVLGAAIIPLGFWIARRVAGQRQRWPWVAPLLDDLGGQSLSRALARLDELAAFERDAP